MALDLSDLYLIHALSDRNNIRQRAENIQDMFGARPEDLETFRKENGGFGIMGAIGTMAVVMLGAVVLGIFFTSAATALAIGAVAGVLAGAFRMILKNETVMRQYNGYLSDFATQAREVHDRQQALARSTPLLEQEQTQARTKNWAADIDKSRTTAPALGATTP